MAAGRHGRRLDGLWDAERVIIEGDGRRWHERRDAMLGDRRRDREAQVLSVWRT